MSKFFSVRFQWFHSVKPSQINNPVSGRLGILPEHITKHDTLTALCTKTGVRRRFALYLKLLHIDSIDNMHSTITLLLLFISTYSWCSTWEFAPSSASANPESSTLLNFQQLDETVDLRKLAAEDDGWFWLRNDIEITAEDSTLLVFGTNSSWSLWLDDALLASRDSDSPRGIIPSLPIPMLISLPKDTDDTRTILMKVYLRGGYSKISVPALVGEWEELTKLQLRSILIQLGIPMLTVLFGLLLFAGGIATYTSGRIRPRNALSAYGLLIAIVYTAPILTLIPDNVSWETISIIATAALPYAISSWRKFGTSLGIRTNHIINAMDLIIATAISLWLITPHLGFPLIPEKFHPYFDFDPVPVYALISEAAALATWLSCSGRQYRGKTSSLLTFLIAGFPSLISLSLQSSPEEIYRAFLIYGLPLSVLNSLLIVIWQGRNSISSRFRINRQYQISESNRQKSPLRGASKINLNSKLPANEMLARCIRSTLFPESVPWDPKWQLLSVWQGANFPVSGFHDFYLSGDSRLIGFSLMDTGVENLNSLIFSSIVRNELTRCFKSTKRIPDIISRVNRRVVGAAKASNQKMIGIVGQFEEGYMSLLPITWPALLLKRKTGSKVLSIRTSRKTIRNPAIGSDVFRANNLTTLDLPMYHGDIVLIYAPKILELTSVSGEALGLKRLALTLKQSGGKNPREVATNIISELQTFVGTDQIPFSLQLMIIRYT